jgi:hypothetical protein
LNRQRRASRRERRGCGGQQLRGSRQAAETVETTARLRCGRGSLARAHDSRPRSTRFGSRVIAWGSSPEAAALAAIGQTGFFRDASCANRSAELGVGAAAMAGDGSIDPCGKRRSGRYLRWVERGVRIFRRMGSLDVQDGSVVADTRGEPVLPKGRKTRCQKGSLSFVLRIEGYASAFHLARRITGRSSSCGTRSSPSSE